MTYKGKTHLNYQKEYREKNREKAKQYQKKYRDNQKILKSFDSAIPLSNKSYKSRIYVAKIGEDRLKIGASFPFSNRMYSLKMILIKQNIDFTPLIYFDCDNEKIIKFIEKSIKNNFCDKSLGMPIPSFKNEVASINNLQEIKIHVENILNESGLNYYISIINNSKK